MPAASEETREADLPLPGAARVAILVALAAGIVLRFTTTSPLWLDEALSVNIARLPLGDIPAALKLDGHPPLYYVLLHGWMRVFGEGDLAVRAPSGVLALVLVPLLVLIARRLGGGRLVWCTVAVAALSPYLIRFGTETRMYQLVMVLVAGGWLLLDDALRRPARRHLVGLAIVVGLVLWTHYWAMWLLATVGVAMLVAWIRAARSGRATDARRSRDVVAAMVVGGLTFLPWVPTLLFQGSRTGTPWARPVRPTEMLTFTLADLGGGGQAEAIVLGWFVGLLAVVGFTGRPMRGTTLELDLRGRPAARPFVLVIVGTLAIASVVGYATGATYASRYAAVFIPFLLVLAGWGLSRLSNAAVGVALVLLFGLGAIGGYRNITVERSDAVRSASAIEAAGAEGDVVVYCPDQLGPSTSRVLAEGFDQVTYPELAPPERADWVDYTERLDAVDPETFAAEVLERAGDRAVFLVYSTSYLTHEDICPALFNAFGRQRPPEVLTSTTEAWEPAAVARFAPAG